MGHGVLFLFVCSYFLIHSNVYKKSKMRCFMGLTHLCTAECSILIKWISPFVIKGSGSVHFYLFLL